jgi:aquaporin Z
VDERRDTIHGLSSDEWAKRFDDARFENRRLLAELVGTFFLVLVAAGAVTVDATSGGQIGRVASVVAPGLMVMAVILAFGPVSGAHLNPAVTLAFAVRGYFPWRRVPLYVAVQLVAALLACLLLRALFGTAGDLGATAPGKGVTPLTALVMEVVLTFGLVTVILATATRGRITGAVSALGVGGYIALAGLWSSPVSGASMNPARSLGPAAVLPRFDDVWIYVAGPLLGALLAVVVTLAVMGRRGEADARRAAQGEPPERKSKA